MDASLRAPPQEPAAGGDRAPVGAPVSGCPFCPGGEGQLETILESVERPDGGWAARAVPNIFPFVRGEGGTQEVLVETPRHLEGFHALTRDEARAALRLYRSRLRALHREHPGWEAHLFRNQGRDAGTSRSHPHAQLVGLPGATPGRTGLEERLVRSHRDDGRCLVCREASVAGSGERAVVRSSHFSAATLHAPLDPFHLRIFPLRHASSLAGIRDDEADDLADLVLRVAGALEVAIPGVAWNLLVHDHGPVLHPALHWHLELRPRVGRTAGFELMTQVGVSPSDPVQNATRLRSLLESKSPDTPHARP